MPLTSRQAGMVGLNAIHMVWPLKRYFQKRFVLGHLRLRAGLVQQPVQIVASTI